MRSLVALALACSVVAPAQSVTLLGIDPFNGFAYEIDPSTCAQQVLCGSNFGGSFLRTGDAAWDPRSSGVWLSDGFNLGKVGPPPGACSTQCASFNIQNLLPTVGSYVAGLEFVEGRNELWILDVHGNLSQWHPVCPPQRLAWCQTGIPAIGINRMATDLAVDEAQGLVFYSFMDGTAQQSYLHVATLANPCQPFFVYIVQDCAGMGYVPVFGLACDWCNQTLYLGGVDDQGNHTVRALDYVFVPTGPSITFTQIACCNSTSASKYTGLTIRPARATSLGTSCSGGACPDCAPSMVHTLSGDPVLGNALFALRLDGAASNSSSWCVLALGPCSTPGINLGFCGPLLFGTYLAALGPVNTGIGPTCGGTAAFGLGLRVDPTLCGLVLSTQCLVLCAGTGDVALSNCLTWRVQGS